MIIFRAAGQSLTRFLSVRCGNVNLLRPIPPENPRKIGFASRKKIGFEFALFADWIYEAGGITAGKMK